jgi:hypothetical protein
MLIEFYNVIKNKNGLNKKQQSMEIVFVSSDHDKQLIHGWHCYCNYNNNE